MAHRPTRFSQLRWLQVLVCVIAMLVAGVLIGLGCLGYGRTPGVASSVWLVAAGLFILFSALIVLTVTPLILKIESTSTRQLGELRDLSEMLPKLLATLESISENTRISDSLKALAHREEELQALRQTIRNDIRNGRWEAAGGLVNEIDRRFGCEEEAAQLREELAEARQEAIEAKLSEVIAMIEDHFRTHQWERAAKEIERLKRALPDDERIAILRERLETLREQHKSELKKEWDDAVGRGETDHAIEVLKELDTYLTPEEAQELAKVARSVFKEKLLQVGIQFRFAVKEKRWRDALSIGLEIIRDFPNARMAQEVREMLDVLRERSRHVSVQPEAAHQADEA